MCEKLTKKEVDRLKKQDEKEGVKIKRHTFIEEIVEYLKSHQSESGIIYVLSRQDAGVCCGSA